MRGRSEWGVRVGSERGGEWGVGERKWGKRVRRERKQRCRNALGIEGVGRERVLRERK